MPKTPKPHDLTTDVHESEERGRGDCPRIRALIDLVPKDLCRRLIEKDQVMAMEAVGDKIFFPDFEQSELDEFEAVMTSEGISEDEAREMAEFKEFVEMHHGKKFRDLPNPTTPEEDEEYLCGLVDELAVALVTQWRSILLCEYQSLGFKEMSLDAKLLPAHSLPESLCHLDTWLNLLANGVFLFIEWEDFGELQIAFAEALKAKISASDDGVEISEDCRIYLDEGGYRLK